MNLPRAHHPPNLQIVELLNVKNNAEVNAYVK